MAVTLTALPQQSCISDCYFILYVAKMSSGKRRRLPSSDPLYILGLMDGNSSDESESDLYSDSDPLVAPRHLPALFRATRLLLLSAHFLVTHLPALFRATMLPPTPALFRAQTWLC